MNKTNTVLNNVRYVKDCTNGNTENSENNWTEIQAIKDGVNVAQLKSVTGTTDISNSKYITDGIIDKSKYGKSKINGNQCVTIDLGSNYDLDEIAIWHIFDGRKYKNNITSVSSDNANWTTVISNNNAENSIGKRVSAYQ